MWCDRRIARRVSLHGGALAAVLVSIASVVVACPYSIRDSAFISSEQPTTFRLYFVTEGDDAELREHVEAAAIGWLAESNVIVEIVKAGGSAARELDGMLEAGDLADDALPVAVLVSPRNEAVRLAAFHGDSPTVDDVIYVVAETIDSPLRSEMRETLIDAWCMLLVVEGADAEANAAAVETARKASKRIVGTTTELDKVVAIGPKIVRVAANAEEERVTLWSLGLASDGGDSGPRVAMITGRGELRGPVLEGAMLNEENLYANLEMLGRSCSCTTDQTWLAGPVVPMEWTDSMQEAVIAHLGFDPDNPEVVGAISDVQQGLDDLLGFQESTIGYRETYFSPRTGNSGSEEVADEAVTVSDHSDVVVPAQTLAIATPAGTTAVAEKSTSASAEDLKSGAAEAPAGERPVERAIADSESADEGFSYRQTYLAIFGGVLVVLAGSTVVMFRRSAGV